MALKARTVRPFIPPKFCEKIFLPGLNMSVTDAAAEMHVKRQALRRVLAGTAGVSSEMALRIGKLCGNGGDVWLRMQAAHDLWRTSGNLLPRSRP
jgi:addiction module HigA family antidote